jgi:hypothetical protein
MVRYHPVMPTPRRFPPPRQACFIVNDGDGQALAYVYFEEEPGRRSAENLMSHDEAGALALNIAKLPDLLGSRRAMKPPKEKKMQKWEYNLLVQSPNTECARCEEALNGLGRDGWELVTFYVNSAGDNVFVLKKPKEQ